MAKRKQAFSPWPNTVWYSSGSGVPPGLADEVRKRLQEMAAGRIQSFREGELVGDQGCVQFDAAWRERDGGRIKARLRISAESRIDGLLDVLMARQSHWTLIAEADRPWCYSWQSPVSVFFPEGEPSLWANDWVTGRLSIRDFSRLGNEIMGSIPGVLRELSQNSQYTVVITHDSRSRDEIADRPAPALVPLLPQGLLGRVMEIRAVSGQDEHLNDVLSTDYQVTLPMDGAVILPSSPRKDGFGRNCYSIVSGRAGAFEDLLKRTGERLVEYAAVPSHLSPAVRERLKCLRTDWVLPEVAPSIDYLTELNGSLQATVAQLREELGRAEEREKESLRRLDQAASAERRLRERPVYKELADALEELKEVRSGWEAAQLLLDNDASEIAWLRGELARVPGRSFAEPAPGQADGPSSWGELIEFAGDLMPHIRIGDVERPLSKIRGHEKEKLWLRRTWACLEALEAYAQARETHGASVVPNFSAYLRWPQAQVLVSTQLYAAHDRSTGRMGPDARLYQLRTFRVPEQGDVFMGEHFRIGGVVPPAPRMHIYDDLAGKSKLIHVGYIGPHLPTNADRG
ncbi:hypothetical protein ACFQ6C_25950 [Streptomyces sp. NPDC056454]|uniref:hypothetical protein n=1 Tax=Streptomyces sp. NPDC056454 TaxID=3345823 RepID=UPI0036C50817